MASRDRRDCARRRHRSSRSLHRWRRRPVTALAPFEIGVIPKNDRLRVFSSLAARDSFGDIAIVPTYPRRRYDLVQARATAWHRWHREARRSGGCLSKPSGDHVRSPALLPATRELSAKGRSATVLGRPPYLIGEVVQFQVTEDLLLSTVVNR